MINIDPGNIQTFNPIDLDGKTVVLRVAKSDEGVAIGAIDPKTNKLYVLDYYDNEKAPTTALDIKGMELISSAEYEQLLDKERKLYALECGGVDNWGGYSYSMEEFYEDKDDDGDDQSPL